MRMKGNGGAGGVLTKLERLRLVRRSRERRLRWRRRRRLRPLLRWARPVVAREACGEWVAPEWAGVVA